MFIGIKDAGHQSYSGFHGMWLGGLFLRVYTQVVGAEYTAIITMWSISDMVIDGAIAGILCYHLQKVCHPHPPELY